MRRSPTDVAVSVPEAYVLLEGARADAHEVVFLALVELVARGGASLVHVPGIGEGEMSLVPGDRSVLGPVGALGRLVAESEQGVTPTGETYSVTASVAAAFARTWGTAGGFVRRAAWPCLVGRGLLDTKPHLLDSFVIDPWHLTSDGRVERDRLKSDLALRAEWPSAPATALLALLGLPTLTDEMFDALDELEDLITPGDWVLSDSGYRPSGSGRL